MRYVAAALLAALGGQDINAANIEKILGSVGVEAEADKLKLVVSQLAGKSVSDLMAEGIGKLASMPSGGGAAAPAAGGAAPAAGGAPAKEEKKKEEEPEEEEDDDMGFGLFD
uniref:Large ribosomal subunit protein P2 n=1 Tax=Pseudodiaptomus poplesia TaxID=213370 RepID=A0A0U2T7V4_9MAXI|nr:60S acidic ribosomal protein P2 [Pseudodiaptomus poplesia]ALS04705.1 60S acidic ribosomal protein P2 [Pseudodiaptomus poplesia]